PPGGVGGGRGRGGAPRPTPPPPPGAPAGGLLAAIGEIGSGYRDDPRRGCHELSRLLRDHAGRSRGRDLSTASTWELSRKSGDKRVRTLFGRLADLQFGRRAPLPIDLSRICRRAVEVAKAEGWGRAS
ncbi:MAG: hypothetical protein R3325_16690, partial [Thermoanaerobaculia bacterium]|nr:hypothetical protein [Thermoanaerobaculia bacterium]